MRQPKPSITPWKRKSMNDLSKMLDHEIRCISEIADDSLETMLAAIERAYLHALIEKGLRAGEPLPK
jgi:predicted glycosyltransferase